jgi:hypothetical protein
MNHFFKNWKFRFRGKFEFLKFLLSFINLKTQHKTVSYVKLSNSVISENVFFYFLQTLARFGYPKVENLVQVKFFFKSRLFKCEYLFFLNFVFELPHMNIINLQKYRCQVIRIFIQKFLKFSKKIHFLYDVVHLRTNIYLKILDRPSRMSTELFLNFFRLFLRTLYY